MYYQKRAGWMREEITRTIGAQLFQNRQNRAKLAFNYSNLAFDVRVVDREADALGEAVIGTIASLLYAHCLWDFHH
jgi:hypothetical protein